MACCSAPTRPSRRWLRRSSACSSTQHPPGIAELRALGYAEVYRPDEAPDRTYDLCLLADVIEHVGDVVAFLRSMRRYRFERLVVSTPNAFRLRNFLSRGETVNTDHRY